MDAIFILASMHYTQQTTVFYFEFVKEKKNATIHAMFVTK